MYCYYWRIIKFLLKLPKTSFLAVRAHFSTFEKKRPHDFLMRNPKLVLVLQSGSHSEKYQRRPTLQSIANPATMKDQIMKTFVSGGIFNWLTQ